LAGEVKRRPASVFLTGFMGSGKTEVGRALAQQLHWEFVDLDHRIEEKGRPIHEIFVAEGEAAFRSLENASLRELLQETSGHRVVALGGGTFCQQANTSLLRSARQPVVFLDAPVEELWRRCQSHRGGAVRPLLQDRNQFNRLYQQRQPYYAAADLTVQTLEKSAAAAAQEIAEWLRNSHFLN